MISEFQGMLEEILGEEQGTKLFRKMLLNLIFAVHTANLRKLVVAFASNMLLDFVISG